MTLVFEDWHVLVPSPEDCISPDVSSSSSLLLPHHRQSDVLPSASIPAAATIIADGFYLIWNRRSLQGQLYCSGISYVMGELTVHRTKSCCYPDIYCKNIFLPVMFLFCIRHFQLCVVCLLHITAHLIEISKPFLKSRSSLPCLQESATGPN